MATTTTAAATKRQLRDMQAMRARLIRSHDRTIGAIDSQIASLQGVNGNTHPNGNRRGGQATQAQAGRQTSPPSGKPRFGAGAISRVLTAHGKRMRVTKLMQAVGTRDTAENRKRFTQTLERDPRFVQGKRGYWGLADWPAQNGS